MLPDHFGANYHASRNDYADAVIIYLLVAVSVCFLLGVPGPGFKERLKSFAWVLLSWMIGVAIVAMQVTRQWEWTEGLVNISLADPSADHPHQLHHRLVLIRVDVGLTGLNVTFSDRSPDKRGAFYFNEEFDWAWAQGRDGFGPFAGPFNRQFRRGQRNGFPHATLMPADFLIHDGEGLRFGRSYRLGAWHAHNVIWLALATWMAANICLQFSLAPAARLWAVTGALLIAGAVIWACYTPTLKRVHPIFRYGDTDLHLHLGASFWCCVASGIVSLIIGAVFFWLDARYPLAAAAYFGLDPLIGYDECYCTLDDVDQLAEPKPPKRFSLFNTPYTSRNMIEMSDVESAAESTYENIVPQSPPRKPVLVLRRRNSTRFHSKKQAILLRHLMLHPAHLEDDEPVEN